MSEFQCPRILPCRELSGHPWVAPGVQKEGCEDKDTLTSPAGPVWVWARLYPPCTLPSFLQISAEKASGHLHRLHNPQTETIKILKTHSHDPSSLTGKKALSHCLPPSGIRQEHTRQQRPEKALYLAWWVAQPGGWGELQVQPFRVPGRKEGLLSCETHQSPSLFPW